MRSVTVSVVDICALTTLTGRPLTVPSLYPLPLFLGSRADDKSLSFYNVVAGGTIHMVLQLRGGK